jgi:phosphatidylglycerophosphate synthase
MAVKYLHWLGIIACITLIVSCFLPWVYYADINQNFTGFYSYKNQYGRPGKFLVALGAVALLFMLLPKVWAKRANLFICALLLAYAVKSYILFSSCYNNYCPQKLFSLYLMVFCTVIMLVAAIFPKMKMGEAKKQ